MTRVRMYGEPVRASFQPGDKIIRSFAVRDLVYVVKDPVRTKHGKLRLERQDTGSELTTWWTTPDNMPERYRYEPGEAPCK